MPSRNRLVLERDRALPYSKGHLAQSLMASGLAPDRAYRIARIVETELRRGARPLVTTDEVRDRATSVIAREEGEEAVERYRRWHELRHLDRPLIFLIGGAPGTGKSTIATEVARRLGIMRIVSTDMVRQVMRALIAPDVLPLIHTSSFQAASAIPPEVGGDRLIAGFLQQAESVRVGLRGVVERATTEHFPLVLEGVHLIPGCALAPAGASATIVEVLLTVESAGAHQSHFELRAAHTGDARPVERYLDAFGEIRAIQDHLVCRARRAGVAIVDCEDLDGAVRQVMDLTLARVVGAGRPLSSVGPR